MIPKPWSFSSLSDYRNCPRQYHRKRIAKDVEDVVNLAGKWGDYCHRKFEIALNAFLATGKLLLPRNLQEYLPYLQRVVRTPGRMLVERKYAITKQLTPTTWDAADMWCRGIIDVLHIDGSVAHALDHKLGKRRENSDQLKLFALLVFIHHPEVDTVHTAYAWLAEGKRDTKTFQRSDQDWMWAGFVADLTRYRNSFKTMTFDPKPSGLCNGWCPVTDCEYWKPKRK